MGVQVQGTTCANSTRCKRPQRHTTDTATCGMHVSHCTSIVHHKLCCDVVNAFVHSWTALERSGVRGRWRSGQALAFTLRSLTSVDFQRLFLQFAMELGIWMLRVGLQVSAQGWRQVLKGGGHVCFLLDS
mmetsp:Transcript_31914/g.51810  ORF Transcript_31914/g.51810 Transcript_31914/m.51810 type:complete len:130 (+) Transcript_31914:42-431(+)